MDNSPNFHVLFYDALKLLGFEKYLKSIKAYSDVEFNSSTFIRGNQKAFEVVTYFLFNQLKNSDYLRSFRGCYPCLDKTHESDFRKNVISSFKSLERDPNFNHKFLPGIICNPGGDSFVSLYLAFVNYILKKILNVDKLYETSTEDLLSLIEEEESLLMANCALLKEKTMKEEKYCAYFDEKLNSIKQDERELNEKLKQTDQELISKFGTNDTDQLINELKLDFDKIKSHKLKLLFEQNEQVLNTETADIENRIVNLRDFVNDQSLLPVDLIEIKKSFENKLNTLKESVDLDNSNIEDTIEKIDIKSVCYTSTNRILIELTNDLAKKIDLLKQQTEKKKKTFLERNDVQELINYVKSKIDFNPPNLEFKAEKNEKTVKLSIPDCNLTTMDQTLANRSVDEDFNLSITLAEMTCDFPTNENDESYMPNQILNRINRISHIPNLNNINE